MAWPLPPLAVSPTMTRAPARPAIAPVPSVDPSSTTTTSSTSGTPPPAAVSDETIRSTMVPMVAASLRAGMHTDTVRPDLSAASPAASNAEWSCTRAGPSVSSSSGTGAGIPSSSLTGSGVVAGQPWARA